IVGVIGPNGSGKTTLFNCVTGLYRATTGSITFGSPPTELTHLPPHNIVERGISRTFPTLPAFPNPSGLENVVGAVHCRRRAGRRCPGGDPAAVVGRGRGSRGCEAGSGAPRDLRRPPPPPDHLARALALLRQPTPPRDRARPGD